MTTHDPTAFSSPRPPGPLWRAVFAGTLLTGMAASTLVQFSVGTLAPFMSADMGLSRADVGLITTAFFAAGAVLSPVAGRLVDALGGRLSMLLMSLTGAAGVAVIAVGETFVMLIAGAFVAGIALALGNPSTNQLIAAHLPVGGQGVVVGVKQSGVQLMSFLAGLLLPGAAILFGWRLAFFSVVLLPLLSIVGTLTALPRTEAAPRAERPKVRIRELDPLVWWLAAYALLMGVGTSVIGVFVVIYGVEALGMPEPLAGLAHALVGLCGIVSRIVWGRAAERLRRTTGPLLVLAVAATFAALLMLAAQTFGAWLIWPAAAGLGASAAAWNAVVNLAVVRDFPREVSGTASGVVQATFFWGLVSSPVLFGWSVDQTGSYTLGWATVAAMFAISGVLVVVWSRFTSASA